MASLVLLLVFLVVMVAVGVWGMRKTSTLNDFFLVVLAVLGCLLLLMEQLIFLQSFL